MDILELIPQRPPIVMVDSFLGIDDGVSRTQLEVLSDNIFVEEDGLSEYGIIEHVAQSAAARVGYLYRSRGEAVPVGYIASVNKFRINAFPKVGDVISTAISVITEVSGISLIEAECVCNGETVATGRMKIFLQS